MATEGKPTQMRIVKVREISERDVLVGCYDDEDAIRRVRRGEGRRTTTAHRVKELDPQYWEVRSPSEEEISGERAMNTGGPGEEGTIYPPAGESHRPDYRTLEGKPDTRGAGHNPEIRAEGAPPAAGDHDDPRRQQMEAEEGPTKRAEDIRLD